MKLTLVIILIFTASLSLAQEGELSEDQCSIKLNPESMKLVLSNRIIEGDNAVLIDGNCLDIARNVSETMITEGEKVKGVIIDYTNL